MSSPMYKPIDKGGVPKGTPLLVCFNRDRHDSCVAVLLTHRGEDLWISWDPTLSNQEALELAPTHWYPLPVVPLPEAPPKEAQ